MAKIKDFVQPREIYRYRPFLNQNQIEREIESIFQGYLWTSQFDILNDPTEGHFQCANIGDDFEGLLEGLDEEININYRKRGIGICSFSETHTNEIMWAHYASGFSGICIEYDVISLLKALPSEDYLVRVFYDEKIINIPRNPSRDNIYQILSRKSFKWQYEREWRLLSNRLGRVELIRNAKPIKSICMGIKMPNEYEGYLLERCISKGIDLKEMKISDYKIDFYSVL